MILLSTTLLIASGICGVDQSIETRHGWYLFVDTRPRTPLANALSTLDLIAFWLIVLSAAGLIVSVLIWLLLQKRPEEGHDQPSR